jgi:hypothetical protein
MVRHGPDDIQEDEGINGVRIRAGLHYMLCSEQVYSLTSLFTIIGNPMSLKSSTEFIATEEEIMVGSWLLGAYTSKTRLRDMVLLCSVRELRTEWKQANTKKRHRQTFFVTGRAIGPIKSICI